MTDRASARQSQCCVGSSVIRAPSAPNSAADYLGLTKISSTSSHRSVLKEATYLIHETALYALTEVAYETSSPWRIEFRFISWAKRERSPRDALTGRSSATNA